jgi:hypothetical protein
VERLTRDGIPLFHAEKQQKTAESGGSLAKYDLASN